MKKIIRKGHKGQTLVIMAVAMFVLLIFIGLALDGTMLFLNYTRLKRAVDASAVAAANDFKRGSTVPRMQKSVEEILNMHQLDMATINEQVFICDADGDGTRDDSLRLTVPEFYRACPATGSGSTALARKLVFVRAFENSPTYFMHLIGIGSIRITTTAIAEAAPIDLVIVLDTSESMGKNTTGYVADAFDPASCNSTDSCYPLRDAKNAAKALIDTLYRGYDRVAVVSFDTMAITRYCFAGVGCNGDLDAAKTAIDNMPLHDDAPATKLNPKWYNNGFNAGYLNPVNPEDRDNNGLDADNITCTLDADRWDEARGIPCDDATVISGTPTLDAFDWSGDGYTVTDHNASLAWMNESRHNELGLTPPPPMSIVSTCSGCGIREATANLVTSGRPNAVWVMVFLSDGVANMSDTPRTYAYNAGTHKGIPAEYPNGYCGGGFMSGFWMTKCRDADLSVRYCIDENPLTCPPSSTSVITAGFSSPYSPPYSVEDYARDMVDDAALLSSTNINEPRGNDIAIYTVGFGDAAAVGEPLLRYMAAVGDDGDRTTDPCAAFGVQPRQQCGQYYFAERPEDLLPIFENIASRIYTKISE